MKNILSKLKRENWKHNQGWNEKKKIKDWHKNFIKVWERKNTHRNINEELKQANIYNKAKCSFLNMDLTNIIENWKRKKG